MLGRRAKSWVLVLALTACTSTPTSRLGDFTLDQPRGSTLTVTVTSNRPDLSADGTDTATITVTVKDAANLPVPRQALSLHLSPVGYIGPEGLLSRGSGAANDSGVFISTYTAPSVSIVPTGALVRITAVAVGTTLNPAPTGKVDIILMPKGVTPGDGSGGGGSGGGGSGGGGGGGGTGGTGTPGPLITSILPSQAPPDVATAAIILGQNFDPAAVVTFRGGALAAPRVVSPALAEPTRIRFTTPVLDPGQSGAVEVLVSNPGGAVSNVVPFTFASGAPTGPVLTAVSPTSSPTAGHVQVTLTGSNLGGSDTVVFAGANIPGGEVTICGPGGPPTCDNKTALPKAAGCVAGVIGDFSVGGGGITVITQCVGPTGGGPAEVFVRRTSGEVSNSLAFGYAANPNVLQPVIASIQQGSLAANCPSGCSGSKCCTFLGYQFIVVGSNFDPCASVILVHNGVIHEFLPDRKGLHQANAPSKGGIQCSLDPGLPGSCDPIRPDLVPYPHDRIVPAGSTSCSAFAPPVLARGVYVWQDANEIRLLYGPEEDLGCGLTDDAQVYVSNKPGTGLVSDGVSAPFKFSFQCPK